jgi:methylenetetrahydrofolate reductase (NADPH)
MDERGITLLANYTAEVTPRDRTSIETAMRRMTRGSEVFVASLRPESGDLQIPTAALLSSAGLRPVPHILARNIGNIAAFDLLLGRLTTEANVDRVLLLAGDRDSPVGEFHSSLQLLESGLLERHGIKRIFLAAHPEGHPRVAAEEIVVARLAKFDAAERRGMHVTFISQFCFEPGPIISLAREMRAEGISAPLRIGIAGPASRASLVKYALFCGIGPSLRALKERHAAAINMLSGETPEALIMDLATARAAASYLGIIGVHFFAFGSLARTIEWVEELRRASVPTSPKEDSHLCNR